MQVHVNARNRGYAFTAEPGERILHAGLRAGVELPYECGTGTCGTCKAKSVSGRVLDSWPQAPGKRYVKEAAGEFLMCQCTAEGDVTLEVAKFVHGAEPGASRPGALAGSLADPRALTHDVMSFALELEAPRDFDAGQFFLLGAPGVRGYRAFSMCNFDRRAERLEFVIKKKPEGGFSEWLFGANRHGARLQAFGPLGKATFYPELGKNLLLICGGSGVAGMLSILSRAVRERYFERHRGWLFFGVRRFADAFFLDALSKLKAEGLSMTVALSEEDVPPEAKRAWPALEFARGFVHEVARAAMAGRYQNVRAYVAGPPPAVDAAIRVLLLEAKLSTDNIRYDKFS